MKPSFQGGNNLFGIGGPAERLRLCAVVLLNEAVDGDLALGDGVENRMLQSAPDQFREEPLHRIHPGGCGRREMKRPVGIPGEPGVNLLGLVRRGVVENDMHIAIIKNLPSPDNSNYFLTRQGKWIIILLISNIKIRKDISPMNTHCNSGKFTCQMPGGGRRRIDLDFSGGTITSNAGVSL